MGKLLTKKQIYYIKLSCGPAAGLLIWGGAHFMTIVNMFNSRMNRIDEEFINATNVTTNTSACDGSLSGGHYYRDNCPPPIPPITCHDLCKKYFHVDNERSWAHIAEVSMFLGLAIVLCFFFYVVCDHWSNYKRTRTTSDPLLTTKRLSIYTPLNSDPKYPGNTANLDIEELMNNEMDGSGLELLGSNVT